MNRPAPLIEENAVAANSVNCADVSKDMQDPLAKSVSICVKFKHDIMDYNRHTRALASLFSHSAV